MQQDFLHTINEFGKHAYDAARTLSEINGKLVEQAIETQLAVANLCVEGGIKQVKLAQDTKDVGEFWHGESKLIEEYSNRFMALAKEQVELAQQVNQEYQAWVDQGWRQANGTTHVKAKNAA